DLGRRRGGRSADHVRGCKPHLGGNMTTPTEQQIEAARRAIKREYSKPHRDDEYYEALAKAALTAAAEVGPYYEGSAEQLKDEFNLGWEKGVAAERERCARIVEKDEYAATTTKERIAAAIRAGDKE